jgi:hypothetical protein
MFRNLISKLNRSVSKQVVAARRDYVVPIKLTFEPDRNTGKLRMPVNELAIIGETRDLSHSGIGFVVSAIRLKEYYLVGEDRVLNAELDLPNGKVKFQIVGQRYEQVGEHISVSKYLIGAKIVNMSEENREVYKYFLRHGKKVKRGTGTLQLGIDES